MVHEANMSGFGRKVMDKRVLMNIDLPRMGWRANSKAALSRER